MIEGVSFQYVNEECEACKYFQDFGSTAHKKPDNDVEELA